MTFFFCLMYSASKVSLSSLLMPFSAFCTIGGYVSMSPPLLVACGPAGAGPLQTTKTNG